MTFDLENSRFGVWGPRGFLRGFQFHPPSREDGRMDRRLRALLSDVTEFPGSSRPALIFIATLLTFDLENSRFGGMGSP